MDGTCARQGKRGNRGQSGLYRRSSREPPGRAGQDRAYPASFSRGAIVAYVSGQAEAKEFREAPSQTNGWTPMIYKRDPKRATGVTVTQAPSPRNHWRKVALRADRKVSALVIDWEVVDHKR